MTEMHFIFSESYWQDSVLLPLLLIYWVYGSYENYSWLNLEKTWKKKMTIFKEKEKKEG